MFNMFDELKKKYFKKITRLNRFQEPNEKSFKKIKRLKSLQKTAAYLEPMRHLRWSFLVNILNGLIFSQCKLHHRSSTGLYIGP